MPSNSTYSMTRAIPRYSPAIALLPGTCPDDVVGEDLGEGGVVARRARLVLSAEKLLVRVHENDPIR